MNIPASNSSPSADSQLIAQLRQSMGMLQVAFDAASEAMVIIDEHRKIHWANQASAELFVSGVPIQVLNQNLADVLKLIPLGASAKAALQLLDDQTPLPRTAGECRCEVLVSDREASLVHLLRWRPVELIRSPFVLVTLRDLSPEERALVQQQRFMTDLTHELRTPLAIVSGNLQRMARVKSLSKAVSSRLTMAREEMSRIQKLLSNLSLITRLEVEQDVLACGDHCLGPLLRRWYHSSREMVPTLEVKFLERGDDVVVQVDPRALVLTLDQLLDNACYHGDRTMPIQLSLVGNDGLDYFVLDLASQSFEPPVDPEDLELWLSPFFSGKLHRDGHRSEGSGLGLSLAQELVKGCGGQLSLHQDRFSEGTTTIVRLKIRISPLEASTGADAAVVRTDRA